MAQQRDYEYKLVSKQLGGHVHCRLFSRRRGQVTWAKCGDLVFCEEEWVSAKLALAHVMLELEDGQG